MISVDQSTNDKGQDETKGNNVKEVDERLLPVEENTTSEEKEQLPAAPTPSTLTIFQAQGRST